MTKKDYEALAAAFARTRPDVDPTDDLGVDQWRDDVNAVADALAADNPRFDRERFYRACGYATTESTR